MYLNQQNVIYIMFFVNYRSGGMIAGIGTCVYNDHRFLRCLFLLLFRGYTSARGKLAPPPPKKKPTTKTDKSVIISVPHHLRNFHCDIKLLLTPLAIANVLCLL